MWVSIWWLIGFLLSNCPTADKPVHAWVAETITAQDLPGYAVGLYSSYVIAPELVRLASWNRLERMPAGDLLHRYEALTPPKFKASPERRTRAWDVVTGQRHLHRAAQEDRGDQERRHRALRLTVQRALVS